LGKKIEPVKIKEEIEKVEKMLKDISDLPPQVVVLFNLLIQIIQMFLATYNTNSKNSSKPPSQDPNRPKPHA